ncbi:hypothetical protein [uncultured Halopseudomonas sp.]|uniref:hypothetical protein n=1 Tax=uncultured Halopseudomonas sp. TaxID=2901193 RepID=UPI0030EBBBAC|tara:strand:- start:730 stop:1350 length:621 start_codon:yes stop_codon:yes gene_type:complete
MYNSLFRSLIAISLVGLSGCASWSKPITPGEVLTGKESYLYGKFKIDAQKAWLGLDGHQTMGSVFSCVDGKKYTIRFERDQPIQVIKLNPTTCSFTEIIFTDSDGVVLSKKSSPLGLIDSVTTVPGAAYYIGDYFAVSTSTPGYNSIQFAWEVKEVNDNYGPTTAVMKEMYPNMTFFPTHNQLAEQRAWGKPAKTEKPPSYARPSQ